MFLPLLPICWLPMWILSLRSYKAKITPVYLFRDFQIAFAQQIQRHGAFVNRDRYRLSARGPRLGLGVSGRNFAWTSRAKFLDSRWPEAASTCLGRCWQACRNPFRCAPWSVYNSASAWEAWRQAFRLSSGAASGCHFQRWSRHYGVSRIHFPTEGIRSLSTTNRR